MQAYKHTHTPRANTHTPRANTHTHLGQKPLVGCSFAMERGWRARTDEVGGLQGSLGGNLGECPDVRWGLHAHKKSSRNEGCRMQEIVLKKRRAWAILGGVCLLPWGPHMHKENNPCLRRTIFTCISRILLACIRRTIIA